MTRILEHVADGDWNTVRRNFEQTDQRLTPPIPQARIYNSAAISIANATFIALTFDSERYDNGSLHDSASNTSRLTAPIAGLYSIGFCAQFAFNATGIRQALLRVNGATFIAVGPGMQAPTVTDGATIEVSTEYQLAAGDYVEAMVFQRSGGALNVLATGNFSPEFWMHRVSGYTNAGVG